MVTLPTEAVLAARAALSRIPKVELHLHLEGSIRPALLLELAEHNHVDLGVGTVEGLATRYRFRDFRHFIELYLLGMSAIRTGDDLVCAIDALATELASQHVRYAEVTTTAYAHHANGMPTSEYRDALDIGARRARDDSGVELRWIVDIPRSVEPPTQQWTVEFLTSPNVPADVVAIGLGGPEAEYPPEWYAQSFERAAASGVPAVLHAGENAGPRSVWKALELGTVRIGHGVRSMEDPTLVEHLVQNQVPVEVSVTSNVALGVCPSLKAHPLPAMLDAGVNISVNTDDPAYFSTTLVDEHVLVHEELDVPISELVAAQHRAIDSALCAGALKDRLHRELAADSADL
ncbi:MAG: adenosine deaminase [Acidimicrobiales bacterium]